MWQPKLKFQLRSGYVRDPFWHHPHTKHHTHHCPRPLAHSYIIVYFIAYFTLPNTALVLSRLALSVQYSHSLPLFTPGWAAPHDNRWS